jgi:hypothetical protein
MRAFVCSRFALVAVIAALSPACIGGGSEATGKPAPPGEVTVAAASDLHRPFDLPTVALGAACPRTPGGRPSPDVAIALGSGPAYPVLGFEGNHAPPSPKGVVPLYANERNGRAYWHKTLWAVDPAYERAGADPWARTRPGAGASIRDSFRHARRV